MVTFNRKVLPALIDPFFGETNTLVRVVTGIFSQSGLVPRKPSGHSCSAQRGEPSGRGMPAAQRYSCRRLDRYGGRCDRPAGHVVEGAFEAATQRQVVGSRFVEFLDRLAERVDDDVALPSRMGGERSGRSGGRCLGIGIGLQLDVERGVGDSNHQ